MVIDADEFYGLVKNLPHIGKLDACYAVNADKELFSIFDNVDICPWHVVANGDYWENGQLRDNPKYAEHLAKLIAFMINNRTYLAELLFHYSEMKDLTRSLEIREHDER